MRKHYGHFIRILHWCTDQSVTEALSQMDLTAAQGRIMGYLSYRKTPPCSRDIEEEFQLTHPTVSGLLSRLEKKGFIEFRPDEEDRRCKRIYRIILENEEKMVRDFTDEEKELFGSLLGRAIANMGADPCRRKHKEERNEC